MFRDRLGVGNFTLTAASFPLKGTGATHCQVEKDKDKTELTGFQLVFTRRSAPPPPPKLEMDEGGHVNRCSKRMGNLKLNEFLATEIGASFDPPAIQSTDSDTETLSWNSPSASSHSKSNGFDSTVGNPGKDFLETEVVDLSSSDSESELLTPSRLCDIPCFLFGEPIDDGPISHYGSRTYPLNFPSRPGSPVSSIVCGNSSTCSDHPTQGENWFEEGPALLKRRTKTAPKHRKDVYRVVPSCIFSKVTTIHAGIKSKRVITTQCSIEKIHTQNNVHQLVIHTCKDVLSKTPNMKFKESGLAMLIRVADEYVQAVVDDFRVSY